MSTDAKVSESRQTHQSESRLVTEFVGYDLASAFHLHSHDIFHMPSIHLRLLNMIALVQK